MIILKMVMMTKPYEYEDGADDDRDHKNDNYANFDAVPSATSISPGSMSPGTLGPNRAR